MNLLQTIRKIKNESVRSLANKTNISFGRIRHLESVEDLESEIKLTEFESLKDILNISREELFGYVPYVVNHNQKGKELNEN